MWGPTPIGGNGSRKVAVPAPEAPLVKQRSLRGNGSGSVRDVALLASVRDRSRPVVGDPVTVGAEKDLDKKR